MVASDGHVTRCVLTSSYNRDHLKGKHQHGFLTYRLDSANAESVLPADRGKSEFAHHLTIVAGRELFQRFKMHVVGNESN